MDSKNRDDPWRKAGTMRDDSGDRDRHSIGSDFDENGNPKEDQPKEAEQTDFFDLGGNSNNNTGATTKPDVGGFDFDFGTPAPQVQSKPAAP